MTLSLLYLIVPSKPFAFLFMRWEVSSHRFAVLYRAASRISPTHSRVDPVEFFSTDISFNCNHTNVLTQ